MWQFCPICTGKLKNETENIYGICTQCGQHWYKNPHPTSFAMILKGNKLLLVKRAIEPEKGKWDLPGGFLQPGEDPIESVRREVKEELGIELKKISFFGFYKETTYKHQQMTYKILDTALTAEIASGDPKPQDDVSGIMWLDLKTQKIPPIAFANVEHAIQDLKRKLNLE